MTGEKAGWSWHHRPVAVEVECGEEHHTVVWRRGKVVLCDHDGRGEDVLAALGGDSTACLDVLRGWRRATLQTFELPPNTLGLVARHGPAPPWAVQLPRPLAEARQFSLTVGYGRDWRRGDRFRHRIGTNVVATMLEQRARPDVLAWLERAGVAGRQPLDVSCHLLPPGRASAAIDAWFQGGALVVAVWLRPDWLTRVWLRGRSAYRDGFVLDCVEDGTARLAGWDDDTVTVSEVRLPLAPR